MAEQALRVLSHQGQSSEPTRFMRGLNSYVEASGRGVHGSAFGR